jgi:Ca2+-binding RTX toxin-like protein
LVTVTGQNDPPLTSGIPDVTHVYGDASTGIDLTQYFSDAQIGDGELTYSVTDNCPLLFSGVSISSGTLTLDYATGVYVYGHGQITVCATDLQDLSVDATFAVRSEATAANLAMDAFTVDNAGDFSVSYTISGQEAEPFTIGVYGSPGGTSYQPTELLQTCPVTDPSLLAVGGPYTVTFAADLGELDSNCFLVAYLDVYNNVRETTKADNVSAPLSGVFQTDDGSVYAFAPVTAADAVNEVLVSQDSSTGDVTITLNRVDYLFSSVSGITIATPTGDNTIDAAGVSVPLTIYGGAGSDTIAGGDGGDTIYGGAAGGNVIQGGSGGNTIYGGAGGGDTIHAGSGGDTIYGGASGDNWIYGGNGGDALYTASGGGDTIVGGSGDDTIYGQGTVSNTISDGDGNDTIYAGSGGDTITAGDGNDQVFGGAGDDTITVGNGNDWVQGGGGSDSITAGTGNDWIYGGAAGTTVLRAGDIDSATPMIVPGEDNVMAGTGTAVAMGGQLLDSAGGQRHATIYYGDSDSSSATFSFYGSVFTAPSFVYSTAGVYYASVTVTDADGHQAMAHYTVIVQDTAFAQGNQFGIIATVPTASKPEQSDGQLTIYWNVSQPTNLVVYTSGYYSSAVSGVDYQPLPWESSGLMNITVGPGTELGSSSEESFDVAPIGDGTGDGDKTLVVEIGANEGTSNESEAVVTIDDDQAVPVVSIQPVNQAPQPDVTPANADAYANWQDSWQPIQIPIEGEGHRVQLDLHAAIDQLLSNATDWSAVLPNVQGLDFWTASQGGTPMTADANGNLIDQAFSDDGTFDDSSIWVTYAANNSASSTIAFDAEETIGDSDLAKITACASTVSDVFVQRAYDHVDDLRDPMNPISAASSSHTITIFVGHTYDVRPMINAYLETNPPKNNSIALAVACQDEQPNVRGKIENYYGQQWLAKWPWAWSSTKVAWATGLNQVISGIPALIDVARNAFQWGGGSHYLYFRIVMDYDADFNLFFNMPGNLPSVIGGGSISTLAGSRAPEAPSAGKLRWWLTTYQIRLGY